MVKERNKEEKLDAWDPLSGVKGEISSEKGLLGNETTNFVCLITINGNRKIKSAREVLKILVWKWGGSGLLIMWLKNCQRHFPLQKYDCTRY